MSFSIAVIGKPGGSKSTTIAKFLYEFTKMGIPQNEMPIYVSDRILLENRVLTDVRWGDVSQYRYRSNDGALQGDHSVLFDGNKPPGQRKFEITDPSFLNDIHDEMVERMLFHTNPNGEFFEYATGPAKKMGNSLLDQDGDSLVDRFRKFLERGTPINRVVLFEVDAGLEERIKRNGDRPDGMTEHTFRTFFGDGGELRFSGYAKLEALGVHFEYIDNDHHDIDRFLKTVEGYADTIIRPLALERSNLSSPEGRVASTQQRDRR